MRTFTAVEHGVSKLVREKRHAHTEKYVAMVNLSPARNKKPSELSGGMLQRVSLARALAMDPQVLLWMSSGALDALTRATLQDEVRKYLSGIRRRWC